LALSEEDAEGLLLGSLQNVYIMYDISSSRASFPCSIPPKRRCLWWKVTPADFFSFDYLPHQVRPRH
jgi:hypothetical protein